MGGFKKEETMNSIEYKEPILFELCVRVARITTLRQLVLVSRVFHRIITNKAFWFRWHEIHGHRLLPAVRHYLDQVTSFGQFYNLIIYSRSRPCLKEDLTLDNWLERERYLHSLHRVLNTRTAKRHQFSINIPIEATKRVLGREYPIAKPFSIRPGPRGTSWDDVRILYLYLVSVANPVVQIHFRLQWNPGQRVIDSMINSLYHSSPNKRLSVEYKLDGCSRI